MLCSGVKIYRFDLISHKNRRTNYFVTICAYNNKTKDGHRQEASNITYSIVVSIFDVCPPSQPASASNNVKTQRFDWFR